MHRNTFLGVPLEHMASIVAILRDAKILPTDLFSVGKEPDLEKLRDALDVGDKTFRVFCSVNRSRLLGHVSIPRSIAKTGMAQIKMLAQRPMLYAPDPAPFEATTKTDVVTFYVSSRDVVYTADSLEELVKVRGFHPITATR